MGKLITIDYEEYLELEKLKKVFDKLKDGFQDGRRNERTNEWIWHMGEQTELFYLIAEASMCPDYDRYNQILIRK